MITARHDVEQLAGGDVDDLGRPPLRAERAVADVQRLVQPDRLTVADPVRVVIDERGAVGDHGVHHGVPVTAQVVGDLG